MTVDLKPQIQQVRAALEAKRAEAAQAWTAFDDLRQSAVKEKVDFATNTEAFDKLDQAGAAHDAIAVEVKRLENSYARLLELSGESGPALDVLGGDGGSHAQVTRSWAKRFTDSEVYKATRAIVDQSGAAIGVTPPVKIAERSELVNLIRGSVNAVLTGTVTGGGAGSGGDALFEERLPGITGIPQAPLNVLDLIMVGETNERVVSWIVETLFTNNAAETAENALKPESSFGFDEASATVRDIAHWTKVTRQMFRDVAALQSWIDGRMRYGVRRRLQRQIVSGDGTGVNLLGLYNQPGTLSQSIGTDPLFVALHKAITKIRTTYFDEPTGILINPTDWEGIRLAQDNNGNFYYGGPAGSLAGNTVWGFPVALSVDAPVGFPMVGAFREANLWVREGLQVASTDSNEDDFKYNRIMLRAEMAGAFGVTQPAAFAELVA